MASGQVQHPGRRTQSYKSGWKKLKEQGVSFTDTMKALVKEEMNPVDLRNLEERINLKDGSKIVMTMHKLGRISLAESKNSTENFARIEEQVTILSSDPNEKMISEWMHILLLQSSLTEEFTLARGFISQNP